jgi:hypothetical protein
MKNASVLLRLLKPYAIIAASAIELKATLLSTDTHFKGFSWSGFSFKNRLVQQLGAGKIAANLACGTKPKSAYILPYGEHFGRNYTSHKARQDCRA